ncbi:MAG: transcription elongation factor GreA [Chloroflexi bacterium]|nr:transcription elongation factor GreA [Chloroflexota bacterium]
MDNSEHYLTALGAKKIKEELEQMKAEGRQSISARLKAAIEMGDLSENADYTSAKEDQGFLEGRIQELEFLLQNSIIIDDMDKDKSLVSIGDTVTIKEGNYPEETYYVVGSKEADPRNGMISHISPLGRAIIGHKAGEQVKVDTPDGPVMFTIIRIE